MIGRVYGWISSNLFFEYFDDGKGGFGWWMCKVERMVWRRKKMGLKIF